MRIVPPLVIHDKAVFVTTGWNLQVRPPNPLGVLAHWHAFGITLVEITGDEDFARLSSGKKDFNGSWL
jgi:hypothetical protein